jgi:peptidoglycan/xylan/chitin deacetylase (PgdA/CDA1 family)
MALRWSPYRLLSPGGDNGKLNIFIFHRVRPASDPLFPTDLGTTSFAELLAFLRRWFNVLPLLEAVSRLENGTLPPAAASVTFDDGYADNAAVALPLLQRFGVPATIFVATGYLDGGRMWNDTVIEAIRSSRVASIDLQEEGLPPLAIGTPGEKRAAIDMLLGDLKYRPAKERERLSEAVARRAGAALPEDLMLTSDQVRRLHRAGIAIGAHTVTHPILARTDAADAEREINESRRHLESVLQAEVRLFAYPNGKPGQDYLPEHVRMVRDAGFRAAVSTARGVANARSDSFELPRFTPFGRTPAFALRMAQHLARGGALPGQATSLAR